jgi:hypothetical protein
MLLGGESKGALINDICIGETVNVQVGVGARGASHNSIFLPICYSALCCAATPHGSLQ